MINGGLLHSPPNNIKQMYSHLFSDIEICVQPTHEINRFEAYKNVTSTLEFILNSVVDINTLI